ncbi:MAG: ribonuclease III [Patescibacteria group bacterium]
MNIPQLKNKQLFEQAFIHRSYLNEAKEKISSNERLEFLGDSVISFVISEHLFNKFPNYNEGILTNMRSLLVSTKSLAELSRDLDFGNFLKLSKGEEESKGRQNQSLLADSFEAYVGALFIDSGIEITKNFLIEVFNQKIQILETEGSFKDPKSLLQEFVQSRKQNSPIYKVLREHGPAHSKIFTMGVFIEGKLIEQGDGKSKQEAEENAAVKALEKLKQVVPLE